MGADIHEQAILLQEELEQLTYEKNQLDKELNKIKQSSSWKYSKFLRFFKKMKESILPNHLNRAYVRQLEDKYVRIQQIVFEQAELLERLLGTSEELSTLERQQYLRELKNEGKLLKYMQSYVTHKKATEESAKEALIYIARLYMNEETTIRDYVYGIVRSHLAIEELPEFILRPGLEGKQPALHEVTSFRASLSMRLRNYQYNNRLPEWILDDKQLAYSFVEQLGIKTPAVDKGVYTLDSLPESDGIVIKPADGAGARGVYIIHDESDIIDVKQSKSIKGYNELYESMKDDLASGAVANDAWLIESIVYENSMDRMTGRDLKFYCFYGKVGLILEIIRYPEIRHCWWTRDFKRVTTGKYDESLFSGDAVSPEELQMIEQLSEEIPAPFVRIDFLQSENGLVFGEFTPKPGNYDEFDKETDRRLGDYFIEAESKLMQDLLAKKEFTHFERMESIVEEV